MKSVKGIRVGISLAALSLLGLVACNQPQTTAPAEPGTTADSPPAATAPTATAPASPAPANGQTSQNISIDDLAGRVENALENDQTLRPFDLDADDEGNSIVITGLVQNEEQRARAEQIARQIAPNVEIINQVRTQ